MTMSHRKKTFIVGYLITLAVLCLMYAAMPFVPAVAWNIQAAHDSVRMSAFRQAVSKYRVKQIASAQSERSRIPDVAVKESAQAVSDRRWEMSVADPIETPGVDQQVIDLLKTSSLRATVDTAGQAAKPVGVDEAKKVVSAITSTAGRTSQAVQKRKSSPSGIKVALAVSPAQPIEDAKTAVRLDVQKPRGNSIRIPSIKVDMAVFEGDEKVLDRGAWLMPESARPGQGNTVISAHRYQSFGSKSFYHLDKVRVGDAISVWWNGKEHRYRVTDNVVVKPENVDVLNKSSKAKLTLITCDPVFSTARRRIVVAEFINE